ncbi:unnamed protein product [Arctogadus glacialis]
MPPVAQWTTTPFYTALAKQQLAANELSADKSSVRRPRRQLEWVAGGDYEEEEEEEEEEDEEGLACDNHLTSLQIPGSTWRLGRCLLTGAGGGVELL